MKASGKVLNVAQKPDKFNATYIIKQLQRLLVILLYKVIAKQLLNRRVEHLCVACCSL